MYIYDIIKNKNHPHIIINIKTKFFDIFDYLKIIPINHKSKLEYEYYNNYYFFDYLKLKKEKGYKIYINDLIERNCTNEQIYIFIYNFDSPIYCDQSYIKNIMEKYYTKMVLITRNINIVTVSIKNQCIIINYNKPDNYYNLQNTTICNIIYELYKKYDFKEFKTKIKEVIYNAYKYDIILEDMLKTFISYLLEKAYIVNRIKVILIKESSNIEHKINVSNNKIILYEQIFIKIYKYIKTTLDVQYNLKLI